MHHRFLSAAPVWLLTFIGCSDHRISLEEFLLMQDQLRQVHAEAQTATPAAAVAQTVDDQLGPYLLGPGDVVQLTLVGLQQPEPYALLQARVDSAGKLKLPGVDAVEVHDMTLEEAEDAITAAYVPAVFKDAVAHLTVIEPETTNVLVRGAVTLPGFVKLPRVQRNLLYALVSAGGVSELASGEVVLRRIRRPTEELRLDLSDPYGVQEALALDPLDDGDIVTVEAAMPNTVFVGGLVNAPRPQIFPNGVEINVLQALASSGGLRTDVTPHQATLIRRLPSGEDVHVRLDLDRMSQGIDPNITLAAGDILWVPETVETKVQDFINRNIFLRAGVSVNYSVSGIEFLNRNSQQAGGGQNLENQFDPFGFLQRSGALRTIVPQVINPP